MSLFKVTCYVILIFQSGLLLVVAPGADLPIFGIIAADEPRFSYDSTYVFVLLRQSATISIIY